MGFSQAAYTSVDDFESYTTGAVAISSAFTNSGGGPWTAWNGSAPTSTSLIAITDADSNQFLNFGYEQTGALNQRGAYRSVTSIDNTESGNYYFQVRTSDATPNASFGLTDVSAPTGGLSDFEVQVSLVDDADAGNGLFKLVGQNGATTQDLVTGLSADTWYDIWLVVDNAADTFDVYQGTTGDSETLGSIVGNNLAFRNGTTDALSTFAALSTNMNNLSAGVDNLSYAIPEPSSFALQGGLLALGCVVVRRRVAQ